MPLMTRVEHLKVEVPMLDLLYHYNAWVDVGGKEWTPVVCPFHPDTTPSASYNDILDKFVCHGCGVRGDIIDVVSQVEGLNFREAVEWLERTFDVTYTSVG